tara:strand:- start:1719 stop:2252 length:534 start_codon:yes stop_codon:yes gene_type:complete
MEQCLLENPMTDKNTDHSYLEEYTKLFEYKKNDKMNILEIGSVMFGGGSSIMFNNYFKNADLYAVDILDYPKIFDSYERIHPIKTNAYSQEGIDIFNERKYDIIMDDGSHILYHQKFVANKYMDLLNDNGILLIEDINSIEDAQAIIKSCPKYKSTLIKDLRHIKGRHDDMFVVIFK